ncbi:ankyrin repeat domain-containing protein [Bordetella sp. 15P40C-2]|nr:ankyrin repeat domain-containing protein [Bordetella sp. 15P40C-2]MVW70798.1 hypothetical protein [Bordetella sp. 15P40C-2]MVW79606.1 hypothetical protein [Bordetella sp. 02P26C-1]
MDRHPFPRATMTIISAGTQLLYYTWNYLSGNLAESRKQLFPALNDADAIRRLAAERPGFDFSIWDEEGRSAYHVAVLNNNADVIRALKEVAPYLDINRIDAEGITALMRAIQSADVEVINALIDAKANVDAPVYSQTPLFHAITRGRLDAVTALLGAGAKPDTKCAYGRTALMEAGWNGYTHIARALLDHGADVNARDDMGMTALAYACSPRHTETFILLLDRGADIEIADNAGHTVLMEAASENALEIVMQLIARGVDVNRESDGRRALMAAVEEQHVEIAAALCENGAEVNFARGDGMTPLMVAGRRGNIGLLALLMTRPVDVYATDNDGRDFWAHVAESERAEEVIAWLRTQKSNAG